MNYAEIKKYWKCNIQEQSLGEAEVVRFEVNEDDSLITYLRGKGIPVGRYTKLLIRHDLVMSDTPKEMSDHFSFFRRAVGTVLINGLGLGCCLNVIRHYSEVKEIVVIEKSKDVIDLIFPEFQDDQKIKIIHADAFEYKPPRGKTYNVVWHDIWPNMCLDYLPQMTKLHRKYGKRCDWQGSWSKEYLLKVREEYKNRGYNL